jgi:hypothetical protein
MEAPIIIAKSKIFCARCEKEIRELPVYNDGSWQSDKSRLGLCPDCFDFLVNTNVMSVIEESIPATDINTAIEG